MSAEQDLLRRVPPQNIEAEESVLGAILLDNNCIDAILDAMGAGDLYRESHRLIFQAMTALWDRREPIDATTLITELRSRGVLEQIGGHAYVAELVIRVPTAANAAHYARIVHAMAMYRAIAATASTLASEAYDGAAADIETFADRAGREMLAVCEPRGSGGRVHAGQILPGVLETVAAWREHHGGVTGLSTGLTDLDRVTAGLQPTDLIVIAARPGMGKSAFGAQLALHAALEERKSVTFYSLEMSRQQVMLRMACTLARVDLAKVRAGYASDADLDKLAAAAAKITAADLWVDDAGDLTPLQLRTRARRQKQASGLDLIVLDYVQLMAASSRGETREREVGEASRALKGLAKELNIPIVVLAQLNRQVETRPDRRPLLADLRESGAIEQDADVVMFVYRDDYYHKDSKAPGSAELKVAKQRNGATDTVVVSWLAQYCRFEDYAAPNSYPGADGYNANEDL